MKILQTNLSFSISVLFGALGFISAFVAIFINLNMSLSIKWLLFVLWITSTVITILVKILIDKNKEIKPSPTFEYPIQYSQQNKVFIIRRNENFINVNFLVGCYSLIDGVERLAYLGQIKHVQDTILQIEIIKDYKIFTTIPISLDNLKNLVIKPLVPKSILDEE